MQGETTRIQLTINGQETEPREVPNTLPLVDFLHDELGLTGTKFCCGIGVCRACTVLVRNHPEAPPVPTLSCSTPAVTVNGQSIETVEGLADDGVPSSLQSAFLEHFAFQCGYCTPGFLMAATALLDELAAHPIPESEVDAAISSAVGQHICRCTGYVRYYQAIRKVIDSTEGLVR